MPTRTNIISNKAFLPRSGARHSLRVYSAAYIMRHAIEVLLAKCKQYRTSIDTAILAPSPFAFLQLPLRKSTPARRRTMLSQCALQW